jgi:hypothetical protein
MQPDGSLRCSRCGGTQFVTRHSAGRKLAVGVAVLLASANEVHCVACGAKYSRRVTEQEAGLPTLPLGSGAAYRRAKRSRKKRATHARKSSRSLNPLIKSSGMGAGKTPKSHQTWSGGRVIAPPQRTPRSQTVARARRGCESPTASRGAGLTSAINGPGFRPELILLQAPRRSNSMSPGCLRRASGITASSCAPVSPRTRPARHRRSRRPAPSGGTTSASGSSAGRPK